MISQTKNLLRVLNNEKTDHIPFWFMRQAGRYLPEYKALRSQSKSFLDFCYNPEMASVATLQPIRRFGMDGAIIFSDILVIPHALGMHVWFEEGKGPLLTPIHTQAELAKLSITALDEKLSPVYEALKLTRAALPQETTLIGFAGAAWTLACYMIEGKGSRDFQTPRALALREPEFFAKLLALLVESVSRHAINQIKAGAEVIQIFDSWSGVLSEPQFKAWVIEPTKKIVANIKAEFPDVPVIGFPRLAGTKYYSYAKDTGVDAVNIDGSVTLKMAAEKLSSLCVIQGNLDPLVLVEDKNMMLAQAKEIISTLGHKPFVFNLGHGILPHTPIEHVEALCDLLRQK